MTRRKRGTPEQQARRALIIELLSAANVQSMDDIQNLFKETIAEFMEGSLESELDEELRLHGCKLVMLCNQGNILHCLSPF